MSVKPHELIGGDGVSLHGGPGTSDPTYVTWLTTLGHLIMKAYDLKAYQVAGPGWVEADWFDISAKVTRGATKEEVLVMWRNLLKDRFGLVGHLEARELSAFELVVAKGGTRFAPEDDAGKRRLSRCQSGGHAFIGQFSTGSTWCAVQVSMDTLASRLSGDLDMLIFNKTGLTGKFDFLLEYQKDATSGTSVPGELVPSVFDALQYQLGLKLEARKLKSDVFVVDSVKRVPTQN